MQHSTDELLATLKQVRHTSLHRKLGYALLLLSGLVLVMLWLAGGDGETAVRYRTAELVRGDMTLMVTATGTLQPLNQVEVGSELSGTIASVSVDFNDEVKSGQVLAQLDTSTLESRIVEARASLLSAEARVKEAQATELEMQTALKRCRELARNKMCAEHELDAASAAHQRARAAVASSRAQVAIAQAVLDGQLLNLAKASIRSPINGIVLARKVEPGQTVAASFQTPELFTLAEDLSHMELLVAVDEADIGRIREGQQAGFSVDAFPEQRFTATITQVRRAPQTVEGVVSYETVLSVDNAGLQLLPGMTATAEITTREVKGALLIPNAALRFTPPPAADATSGGSLFSRLFPRRPRRTRPQPIEAGGKRKVWLQQQDELLAVEVMVGESDGRHTELLQGELREGMKLITESIQAKR